MLPLSSRSKLLGQLWNTIQTRDITRGVGAFRVKGTKKELDVNNLANILWHSLGIPAELLVGRLKIGGIGPAVIWSNFEVFRFCAST